MTSDEIDPQLRLFEVENPLKARFEKGFFKQIPDSPGVYWMLGRGDEILYVGKAKSLRSRIRSYRNTALSKHASKTQRLLKRVEKIHWDLAPDEKTALLKENEFLRALKPPFNVVGTKHETYLYFALQPRPDGLELRLLFDLKSASPGMKVFGAFKGLARVRRTHAALLRWIWARLHEGCAWPVRLSRQSAPLYALIPWPLAADPAKAETSREDLLARLELFFSGAWPLEEQVVPEEEPSKFLQTLWRDDQITIEAFFRGKAEPQRRLRMELGLGLGPIDQDRVDDLIVLRRFRDSRTSDAFQHSFSDFLVKPADDGV